MILLILNLLFKGFFEYTTQVFPVDQMVKNLPAMQETQVWSLGREDPLEKGIAIYSRIIAWRIPWTEEPGDLYSLWNSKELDTTEQLTHARKGRIQTAEPTYKMSSFVRENFNF